MKAHQGTFNPRHPERYKGNYPIIFRSSWELKMMQTFDSRTDVLYWSSESNIVHYYHPFKRRMARYFPDFLVAFKDKEGKVTKWLVEVKPYKETIPPVIGPRQRKTTKLYQEATFVVNTEKWKAAEKYCRENGLQFKILTEREIYKYK
jgi:hypothetical protein